MPKIHALEHLFKAKEQGKARGTNKLLNADMLMQEKRVMFQLVRTEVILPLKQKKKKKRKTVPQRRRLNIYVTNNDA